MISEIPPYCLRAYALFFSKHGSTEPFKQSDLDWIVGQSMKKKIFSLLLKSGWIAKNSRDSYKCVEPQNAIKGLLEFKVPEIIKESEKIYAFTGLSAIEIWSDYSYVQRGIEKSPYFIKVLKKDLTHWKEFFNKKNVPNYVNEGSTIGEYIILIPADSIDFIDKDNLKVEHLKKTLKMAKENEMHSYAYNYMRKKYGFAAA
ncbi:MAG: hypothetical protein AABX00_04485 [Nanoarchaeota archaeon]|mgnify:CR=1 FL=1